MQMMKTLVMGAAAAGAAGVAVLTVPDRDKETAEGSRVAASEICLKDDLALVEGVSAKCFSTEELAELRDRQVVDSEGDPVTVSLTHPTDMSAAPKETRTCAEYSELSFDGWYALTSRDMRREAWFTRACGVLAALADAQPAKESFFTDGSPDPEEMKTLAAGMQFGEVTLGDGGLGAEKDGAQWRISSDAMRVQIHEIANADFDNDGVEEILAFTAAAPQGGTAAFYDTGLIEKDTAEAALSFTPLSYGREKAAGPGL
ncbi:hypothetical protein [Hyphococcus sp.]|jgi:hypothetical protein|uniref:hypothetical protein n=1 Tax=Hyphococcus sp. TaxID=2038636 RepID=UPI003D12A36A